MTMETELKNHLEEHGFVCLKNFFPKEVMADFISGFVKILNTNIDDFDLSKRPLNEQFQALSDSLEAYKNSESRSRYLGTLKAYILSCRAKNIVYNPKLTHLISELIGSELISQIGNPVLHVTGRALTFDKPTNAPWHQDWPALKSSQKTLVCWVPFGGAHGDGRLLLKDKSHKSGELPSKDISNVVELDECVIEAFETVAFDMEPGDCIIFDSFLAHGSDASEHNRLAMSFRFEDLECPEWRSRDYSSNHQYILNKGK